ncbi:MAG: hypothetical protein K2Q22_01950, partial [Cytophagales bacterium]|nr:hypothetical protein [Cytophagales bacterium]
YRTEEPQVSQRKDSIVSLKKQTLPIRVMYPDRPRDSECLMVDPIGKLIYVVTKREDSVHVYTLPIKANYASVETFTFRAKLPLKYITAGDISADGSQVVIKNYGYAYYWMRKGNEPLWETMLRSPIFLPYNKEKQGEAVCIDWDGKHIITVGEGIFSKIQRFDIP